MALPDVKVEGKVGLDLNRGVPKSVIILVLIVIMATGGAIGFVTYIKGRQEIDLKKVEREESRRGNRGRRDRVTEIDYTADPEYIGTDLDGSPYFLEKSTGQYYWAEGSRYYYYSIEDAEKYIPNFKVEDKTE